MDRMTFLNGDDMWCVTNDNCFEEQGEHYCGPALEKLAFYEDTGLTPDEIEGLKNTYDQLQASFGSLWLSNQRLGEAVKAYNKAEAEGRLLVLPCKVGDTLFMIKDGEIYDGAVRFMRWENHKDRGVRSDIAANPTPYFSIGASFDDFGKGRILHSRGSRSDTEKQRGEVKMAYEERKTRLRLCEAVLENSILIGAIGEIMVKRGICTQEEITEIQEVVRNSESIAPLLKDIHERLAEIERNENSTLSDLLNDLFGRARGGEGT